MDCVCPRLRKNVARGTQGAYDSPRQDPGLTSGASWAPQVPRALCPRRLLRRSRAQVTLAASSLSGKQPDQVPLAGRHLGAIAQLEERLVCIQKARGSSPLSSTGQPLLGILRPPQQSQTRTQRSAPPRYMPTSPPGGHGQASIHGDEPNAPGPPPPTPTSAGATHTARSS